MPAPIPALAPTVRPSKLKAFVAVARLGACSVDEEAVRPVGVFVARVEDVEVIEIELETKQSSVVEQQYSLSIPCNTKIQIGQ